MTTFKVEKRLFFMNASGEVTSLDVDFNSASDSERAAIVEVIATMKARGFYFTHSLYV